jgi:hypothetical protein
MVGEIVAALVIAGVLTAFVVACRKDKQCPYIYQTEICEDCQLGKKTDYKYCVGMKE